eukprot:9047359-Alexandrium_andersonii.AAC.1
MAGWPPLVDQALRLEASGGALLGGRGPVLHHPPPERGLGRVWDVPARGLWLGDHHLGGLLGDLRDRSQHGRRREG